MRRLTIGCALLLLCLGAGSLACDGGSTPPADEGGSGGSGTGGSGGDGGTGGSGGGGVCAGLDSPHQQLLNAPTGAEVIHKTPAHPPIPEGLP